MNNSKKKIITIALTFVIIAVLTVIDQVIKYFIERDLRPIGSRIIIPNVLRLQYVQNKGSMMGILPNSVSLLTIVSVALLVALTVYIFNKKTKVDCTYVCVVAMISGGIGNIIDRIFRGYVVDYIEALFVDFYVFNFADMLVTCACFVLIGYTIYGIIRDAKRSKSND